MFRKYLFSDEAGDFTFNSQPNVSKYFVVCSVTLESCDVGEALLRLRRQLAWEKVPIADSFHATKDKQVVRDRVFAAIAGENFRIDATILEKAKAQPHVRTTPARFYQYAWYYHFKHVGPRIIGANNELHVNTASIGTNKGQAIYTNAVNDVVQQVLPISRERWTTTFAQAATDPCLQLVDYCTWAIQRKWERADTRSYDLIRDRIRTEFELWRHGTVRYY